MQEAPKARRKPRVAATKSTTKPEGSVQRVRARKQAPGKGAIEGKLLPPVVQKEWIRVAAYFRAEKRGFTPGREMDDWIAAEAEVATVEAPPPAAKRRKQPTRKKAIA
jgi:hypothetical protein